MIKVTIKKSKTSPYNAYSTYETSYRFFADDDTKGIEAFANAHKDDKLEFEKL